MASSAPTCTAPCSRGSSGSRSHSSRASTTCSTSSQGARDATEPSPPRSAISSSSVSRSALGTDPLVAGRAQPLHPLRPRRLARQQVERRPQDLDDVQQGLRIGGVLEPAFTPFGLGLLGGGLTLGLGPRPQAHDPAAQPRNDAGLAAQLVPARGPGRDLRAEHRLEGHRREGEELHHRRSLETAAAHEQQQRAGRSPEAQRQRGMEPVRDTETRQQIQEQRRVGLRAREHDAHLLEGHAACRLAQQPAGDGARLGSFSGGRHQLDGAIAGGGAVGGLEQAARAGEGATPEGKAVRSERAALPPSRPRPRPAVARRARQEAARRDAGSVRRSMRSGRAAARARTNSVSAAIELEIVHHQDLGVLQQPAHGARASRAARSTATGSAVRPSSASPKRR